MRMLGVVLAALALTVVVGGAQQPERQTAMKPPVAPPINLNTATVAQLESLPGIGARTAERIVEYRQKNGSFKKVEELMNVQGLGGEKLPEAQAAHHGDTAETRLRRAEPVIGAARSTVDGRSLRFCSARPSSCC